MCWLWGPSNDEVASAVGFSLWSDGEFGIDVGYFGLRREVGGGM